MNIDRYILAFAGALILGSALLAYFISPLWLILTGFVGLNMFQAAFTGFCPAAIVLRKMGIPDGAAFKS